MTTHAEHARDVRHALADLLAEHGSYSGFVDSMLDTLLREAFTAVSRDAIVALSADLAQLRTERADARAALHELREIFAPFAKGSAELLVTLEPYYARYDSSLHWWQQNDAPKVPGEDFLPGEYFGETALTLGQLRQAARVGARGEEEEGDEG